MLSYAENKGIIDDQTSALRLSDVEVMSLGMRGRMASEEGIRRVLSLVEEWDCECQSMRIILDRVLHHALVELRPIKYRNCIPSIPSFQHIPSAHPALHPQVRRP